MDGPSYWQNSYESIILLKDAAIDSGSHSRHEEQQQRVYRYSESVL